MTFSTTDGSNIKSCMSNYDEGKAPSDQQRELKDFNNLLGYNDDGNVSSSLPNFKSTQKFLVTTLTASQFLQLCVNTQIAAWKKATGFDQEASFRVRYVYE